MQPFDDLSQEQVYFSPSLDVYLLTQEDFEKQGKPIGSAIMAKMLKNNFYIVNIPINIIPKSGYSCNRLECGIGFCPEETNSNQRPIIYVTDVSLLNLNPIIAELHNPETGRVDIAKTAKLLGFSREEMTQLLECSPEDLDNDIESLQIKLYPIYLFIIQFFRLIEQRNIDIESFRMLLNVPTASFFSQPTLKGYKSLRIYLLERDFKALEQFIKSL